MSTKMSDELKRRIQEVLKEDPQREIPVIVTTKKDAGLAGLESKGLKVQNTFKNISSVAGTIPAAEVDKLAQSDEVEIIDYDGEVYALGNAGGDAE